MTFPSRLAAPISALQATFLPGWIAGLFIALLAGLVPVLPASALAAEPVYDDYDAFYGALPGAVFDTPLTTSDNTLYSYADRPGMYVDAQTSFYGQRLKIEIGEDRIVVNGRDFRFRRATTFRREQFSKIYPASATVFASDANGNRPPMLCVTGHSDGSGEANRHAQIYLLLDPLGIRGRPRLLHLPSLLSSCRAVIASEAGELLFPKNTYVIDTEGEARTGLLISYYTFRNRFVAADRPPLRLRFAEPENPFRFTVQNGD